MPLRAQINFSIKTLSNTEENYAKGFLKVTFDGGIEEVGTNELAIALAVKPTTANDMLKKLKQKQLVAYEKYGKLTLTAEGKKNAIDINGKHRVGKHFCVKS